MKTSIKLSLLGLSLAALVGSYHMHEVHRQAAITQALARVERCEHAARLHHIDHRACTWTREQVSDLQDSF